MKEFIQTNLSYLLLLVFALLLSVTNNGVIAGALDPDCSAKKAAKSSMMKATVGVGGRCSPAEAAKDTAKGAAGVEDIDSLKKNKNPLKSDKKKKKKKKKKLGS